MFRQHLHPLVCIVGSQHPRGVLTVFQHHADHRIRGIRRRQGGPTGVRLVVSPVRQRRHALGIARGLGSGIEAGLGDGPVGGHVIQAERSRVCDRIIRPETRVRRRVVLMLPGQGAAEESQSVVPLRLVGVGLHVALAHRHQAGVDIRPRQRRFGVWCDVGHIHGQVEKLQRDVGVESAGFQALEPELQHLLGAAAPLGQQGPAVRGVGIEVVDLRGHGAIEPAPGAPGFDAVHMRHGNHVGRRIWIVGMQFTGLGQRRPGLAQVFAKALPLGVRDLGGVLAAPRLEGPVALDGALQQQQGVGVGARRLLQDVQQLRKGSEEQRIRLALDQVVQASLRLAAEGIVCAGQGQRLHGLALPRLSPVPPRHTFLVVAKRGVQRGEEHPIVRGGCEPAEAVMGLRDQVPGRRSDAQPELQGPHDELHLGQAHPVRQQSHPVRHGLRDDAGVGVRVAEQRAGLAEELAHALAGRLAVQAPEVRLGHEVPPSVGPVERAQLVMREELRPVRDRQRRLDAKQGEARKARQHPYALHVHPLVAG